MALDSPGDLTGQTVELLQARIRNRCVNDGTAESGHETTTVPTTEPSNAAVASDAMAHARKPCAVSRE